MEKQNLFKEYFDARLKAEEYKKIEDEAKKALESHMIENNIQSEKNDIGRFTIAERRNIKAKENDFILDIKKQTDELKTKLKSEEEKQVEAGEYTESITNYLTFTANKE